MAQELNYNIEDKRSYIVLVPVGKERLFVDAIVDLVPSGEEPIKIVLSKKNASFRFYYLQLPENFDALIEKKLEALQENILR